jgi:hypothetical protein
MANTIHLIVAAPPTELSVPGAHRGVLATSVAWRAVHQMRVNTHVLAAEVANQPFLDSIGVRLVISLVSSL